MNLLSHFLFVILTIGLIFGDDSEFPLPTEDYVLPNTNCDRKPDEELTRKCLKKCKLDEHCLGKRKKCVCDGECGLSCVNPGIRCVTLDQLDGGRIEITPSNRLGAVAKYICDEGKLLSGNAERVCQGDGKWSGEEPTCAANYYCGPPPKIPFAFHNGGDEKLYLVGTQLEYSCDQGYHREGFARAMCIADSAWVGPKVTCTPRTCGHPGDVDNGKRVGNVFVYPLRVTYFCDIGYKIVGKQFRACQENGKWTGTAPKCLAIQCPPLETPAHGKVQGSLFVYNSVLSFSCDRGYQLQGDLQRRCQADGTWDGKNAMCKLVECSEPEQLFNGQITGDGNLYGSVKLFKCDAGMKFVGPSTSTTCMESGNWSDPTPKCYRPCKIPSIENGFVKFKEIEAEQGLTLEHGTKLGFECIHGHRLNVDNATLSSCHNGTWSMLPSCAPAPCNKRPPIIRNGLVRYHRIKHGSKAKYKCRTGFKLKGKPYLTCSYGEWNGETPYCDPIYCPYPGEIAHGKVLLVGVIGKYEYRDYVTKIGQGVEIEFQCDQGNSIDGPRGATCVDGVWSPDVRPICIPETHPALESLWRVKRSVIPRDCVIPSGLTNMQLESFPFETEPRNGSQLPPKYYLKLRCDENHVPEPEIDTITCQKGALWSSVFPRCIREPCPIPVLKHGFYREHENEVVLSYQYPHGGSLQYSCDVGYENGTQTTLYCSNGKWHPENPFCTRVWRPCSLPRVDNALVSLSKAEMTLSPGTEVTIQCNTGYVLEGADVMTCTEAGLWKQKLPQCRPFCRTGSIEFHRITGYALRGHNNKVAHGVTEIECLELCRNELDIYCQSTEFYAKEKKCHLSESTKTSRLDDWIQSDDSVYFEKICVPSTCSAPPRLYNGMIQISNTMFGTGTIVRFACNEGYHLSPITVESIICKSDGRWNASFPECVKTQSGADTAGDQARFPDWPTRPCRRPTRDHEVVLSYKGVNLDHVLVEWIAHMSVLVSRCRELGAYHMQGSQLLVCDNGTWIGHIPTCERIDKKDGRGFPSISLVRLPADNTVSEDGRLLVPSNEHITMNCTLHSTHLFASPKWSWSAESTGIQVIQKGTSLNISGTNRNLSGLYTCTDPSLKLSHSVHVDIMEDDYQHCTPPPAPSNGYIPDSKAIYRTGTALFYFCKQGYLLVGSPISYCYSDSSWTTPQPQCQPLKCPRLIVSQPELIVTYSGNNFGDKASFYCKMGYKLIGQREATCILHGDQTLWSTPDGLPTCRAFACPTIDVAQDVIVSPIEHNHTVTELAFTCRSQHQYLAGPQRVTCTQDGTWSDAPPTCQDGCPKITTFPHGFMELSSNTRHDSVYPVGLHVTFNCNAGFVLVGPVRIECQQLGKWSEERPRCMALKNHIFSTNDT